MNALLKMGSYVMADRVLNNGLSLGGKSRVGVGIAAFSGFMLFISSLMFIYASYLWAQQNFAPHTAFMISGLVAMLFSSLGCLSLYAIQRYKQFKIEQIKGEVIQAVEDTIQIFNEEFSEPIQENPKVSAALSCAAGYSVGRKI